MAFALPIWIVIRLYVGKEQSLQPIKTLEAGSILSQLGCTVDTRELS